MRRVKKKIKKRIKWFLLICFIIVIVISLFAFVPSFFKSDKDKEVIINNYAKVNDNSSILDKNGKVIGKIDAGSIIGIKENNDTNYNIIDTNYYISSNDVSIIKYEAKDNYSKYLNLDLEITTKDNVILDNDDKKITINKSDKFIPRFMDDKYYYVNLGNIYYKISKDDILSLNEKPIKDKKCESISVINFNNISEKCDKFECYSEDDITKLFDYIYKSDYYTINLDDFIKWNNGYINLKDKAVLLISSDSSELVNKINSDNNNILNVYDAKYGITFLHNNQANKIHTNLSSLNNYNVRSKTTLDDFKLMMDGSEVKDNYFEGDTASSVPVVNYHFFYDLSKGHTNCKESICLEVSKFREQLKYLKDNGYTTLTMNQFVKWIYGEAEVPKKSVLLTIDDGAFGTGFHNGNNLIPILEEYKMHATLFLISGWWDINNYKSSYLEIQSHTHDMHNKDSAGTPQLIGKSYDEIYNDLNLSINTIGNNETFCYPFYAYDDEAISVIKELKFKVAFAGGSVNATRNSNKYKVPRYPIYDTTSINQFIQMVS